MVYADHCDTTAPTFNNGHESTHEDSCSQNFTNSYEDPACGTTYHVNTGLTWNNVGACETYFIDYTPCQSTRAFADTPFYDHTNTHFYDHEDFPFFDHTDTPFYDHDNTPAHDDGSFIHHCDCRCNSPGSLHHVDHPNYDDPLFWGEWCAHYLCPDENYYDCMTDVLDEHDDYPHDHWYNWDWGSDPGDLGDSDRAHSHSYTGTNIPDWHDDEAHEHSYYCDNLEYGEECEDLGHSDRNHAHSYTGSGSGDDDITHSHTPHINFCNHSDQYSGGC